MIKRFIVVVDNAADPRREMRRERFIGYAKGKGMSWWNQIPPLWLLTDTTGKMTASQLDDDAFDIFKTACIAIELKGDASWAGHGPEEMFQWMRNEWREKPGTALSDVARIARQLAQSGDKSQPPSPRSFIPPPDQGRSR